MRVPYLRRSTWVGVGVTDRGRTGGSRPQGRREGYDTETVGETFDFQNSRKGGVSFDSSSVQRRR